MRSEEQKTTLLAEYQKQWEDIVNRPAMREMTDSAKEVVDQIAKIGFEHARDDFEYSLDVINAFNSWTKRHVPKEKEISVEISFNNTQLSSKKIIITRQKRQEFPQVNDYYISALLTDSVVSVDDSEGGKDVEMMKGLIPIPYFLLELLFLSLSIILGMSFYFGFHGYGFIIGPWTHLVLLVSVIGLAVTVLAGVCEWVYKQDV